MQQVSAGAEGVAQAVIPAPTLWIQGRQDGHSTFI